MPGLPNDPIPTDGTYDEAIVISAPGLDDNGDLPAEQWPSLTRIIVTDLVGPVAANRQHKALQKRALSIAQIVNLLVRQNNDIDDHYLRRDGSAQKSGGAGMQGNLDLRNFKAVQMSPGTDPTDGVNRNQLDAEMSGRTAGDAALSAAIALKADINSPAFTGAPTTPTPALPSDSTEIANTQWVRDYLATVSFASTPRLVDAGQFNTVLYGNGGTQSIFYVIQVERSVGEIWRQIQLGPEPGSPDNRNFNYPGNSPVQFIEQFTGWFAPNPVDATIPDSGWPILASAVRHDDNNPRTQAYFTVTTVWHDPLVDKVYVRGTMKHVYNTGTGSAISRAVGVHTIELSVDNIEVTLFTTVNQKGSSGIYLKASRAGVGQPAQLTIRGERVYGGHGDNRTGFGLWFPYRVVAATPS